MNVDILMSERTLLTGENSSELSKDCFKFLFSGVKHHAGSIGEPEELKGFFKKRKKIILSGDRGIYFTTYSPLDDLIKNYENFSFFNRKFIDSGYVNLIDLNIIIERFGFNKDKDDPFDFFRKEIGLIGDVTKELGVNRFVIDPLSSLFSRFEDINAVRNGIVELAVMLDEIDCKILLTSIKNDVLSFSYDDFNNLLKSALNFDNVIEK